MRFVRLGITLLLVSPLCAAARQLPQGQTSVSADSDDSLAAASRRARDEKKEQPKAVKVWDNDSMPTSPGGINVVGQDSPPAGDRAAPAAGPSHGPTPADVPAIQSDLDAAKQELESLKTDLDILQRKYALDEQMYLSKPEYSSDKAGAAALKDEKDQMDAKQQAIADAQKKIADLQAQLDIAAASKAK
jgi:hypothetical protein